jgi:hypothetical protein
MLASVFRLPALAARQHLRAALLSSSAVVGKHDAFVEVISAELDKIKAAGTYKSERVITSAQKSHIAVAGTKGMTAVFFSLIFFHVMRL